MTDLDIPKMPSRGIKLVLAGTTFPAQFLPTRFVFPTWSTVTICDASVSIEIKVRDDQTALHEADKPDIPTETLELVKANLVSIKTGEKWSIGRNTYPGATLAVRDRQQAFAQGRQVHVHFGSEQLKHNGIEVSAALRRIHKCSRKRHALCF